MAKIKNLSQLIASLEPGIRRAFQQAVSDIKSDVQLRVLEAAIRRGDIPAALQALNMDGSYFRPLDEALRAAHLAGADATFDEVKKAAARSGLRIQGGFDSRNLRAEAILKEWSSEKVVAIKDSIRNAVRETLTEAINKGTSPRSAALDLVGRIAPGGKRVGGVIGLDPVKAKWVQNMGDDLENLDARYFTRKLRDRRYDKMVRRSIADGKPLSSELIGRMKTSYSSRMLKLRGEAIARTELLGSMHAAQSEGLQQLVESGQVDANTIQQTWDASSDRFTRKTHRDADNQVRSAGQPFSVGGFSMRYPGDQATAPAKEVVDCRCVLRVNIDFISGLASKLTPQELASSRALL